MFHLLMRCINSLPLYIGTLRRHHTQGTGSGGVPHSETRLLDDARPPVRLPAAPQPPTPQCIHYPRAARGVHGPGRGLGHDHALSATAAANHTATQRPLTDRPNHARP